MYIATVLDQIRKLQDEFKVEELIFVGDRGMVKSRGKQELEQRGLHYNISCIRRENRLLM